MPRRIDPVRVQALEDCLLTTDKPLSSWQLRHRVGGGSQATRNALEALAKKYGARWFRTHQDSSVKYQILAEAPARANVILDLWRGWKNPVTGYQPERLGV